MNTGAIASRYAKALLKYVQQEGCGKEVFEEVYDILKHPAYTQGETMDIKSGALLKFCDLLIRSGRMEDVKFIFHSFIAQYCRAENIKPVFLTTAGKADGLAEKISALMESKTGAKVAMEHTVDPSIMGGFIVEFDNVMLDASVKHQLDLIEREFIFENN